jgi:hypothetical protein
MEARIAKYLGGNRIPMSGSGSIKGDVRILTQRWGEIMVECKYSAGVGNRGPRIRIDFRWFDKLDQDVKYMKSAFGILIFHYHDARFNDFVILRRHLFDRLFEESEMILSEVKVFDMTNKNGMTIDRDILHAAFDAHPCKPPCAVIRYAGGDLVVFPLVYFKEILDGSDADQGPTRV